MYHGDSVTKSDIDFFTELTGQSGSRRSRSSIMRPREAGVSNFRKMTKTFHGTTAPSNGREAISVEALLMTHFVINVVKILSSKCLNFS